MFGDRDRVAWNCRDHLRLYGGGIDLADGISVGQSHYSRVDDRADRERYGHLEVSPTLVCIVLAGVVGSKIASELGNMRSVSRSMRWKIMGINTKAYLIMPKLLAAGS